MSLGVSFPQSLDCSTYSRHHRILRERRSIGDHSCQKQDTKGNKLVLGAEKRKSSVVKKKETSRKSSVPRKVNIKPDWNTLRTLYSGNTQGERSTDGIDYVDWHAVRRADVEDISNAIKLRGMNNKLAKRIKVCYYLLYFVFTKIYKIYQTYVFLKFNPSFVFTSKILFPATFS